jgi:hypothetical protein
MINIAREGFLTRRGQQELEGLVNDFQEEKRMPLYLDEIYFNISSKEEYKQVCERMTNNMSRGFPPGVTLKAGPWFSNEEPKVHPDPRYPGPFDDFHAVQQRLE